MRDSYILPEILIFCVKNKHPGEFDVIHPRDSLITFDFILKMKQNIQTYI